MNSADIRSSFLEFFSAQGHRVVPSAPLVPHGDPTLLFTNAGMVQFKDCFLGRAAPPAPRVATAQKCMRVSGKHNDLENVGPSPRHHTFFEMLGNFSFGDYFKAEAIEFGWRLVTSVWGLDPAHLWASVFREDDDAARLWHGVAGLPAERVIRRGEADNFWAMGETGPCGPCSEIYVDRSPHLPAADWDEGTESGRYLEIWNLVFMQFDRDGDGRMQPLPRPSIDTGAGLERVAAVLQGVESNYDTDLFRPILEGIAELAGRPYGASVDLDVSMRVVADHLRAVAFLLADAVIPGNEGRGYVLRRVLRRAVRHGMRLGFAEPFLHRLLPLVREAMGSAYPELMAVEQASTATIEAEETKFLSTIALASRHVQDAIDAARAAGERRLSGDVLFRLYDTYGLPVEHVREIAEEERVTLDEKGFEVALEAQRQRSREAGGEGRDRVEGVRRALGVNGERAASRFDGYTRLHLDGAWVQRLARTGGGSPRATERLAEGEAGIAVLDRTPLYPEAGGQVGDRGHLEWPKGRASVLDTQKDGAGIIYHFVEVEAGELAAGQEVTASVDAAVRRPTQRNHTATHLLHAALRRLLGPSVRQAGSLVAPDRLRFDFTHPRPLSPEQLTAVEDLVNGWVLEARDTVITPDRPFAEAIAAGAMALFGEKYGERVRTVEVPGGAASLELCGGCHVRNTGEIGPFLLVAERGIASGVRRIEALTGEAALAEIRRRGERLRAAVEAAGVPEDRLAGEIARGRDRQRELERELARLRQERVSGDAGAEAPEEVAGIKVLAREVPPAPAAELRSLADVLRSRLGSGVVVLGTRAADKVTLVAAVTPDLTDRLHAGRLVQEIAAKVGGTGGGRPDFAQAGGRDADRLPAALAAVADWVRGSLAP
jgi:alanyl-tRNA synthetase